MNNVRCCGLDAYWVENVPGKGYMFCSECKNEVPDGLLSLDANYQPMSDNERDAFVSVVKEQMASAFIIDCDDLNFDGTLYLDVKY